MYELYDVYDTWRSAGLTGPLVQSKICEDACTNSASICQPLGIIQTSEAISETVNSFWMASEGTTSPSRSGKGLYCNQN